MCGFMGGIGLGGDVIRGLPWLRRRGPDGHGIWSSSDGTIKLLHCRLAIVDTDPRADQPFGNKALGVTVALNGEIYNYRALRREFAEYGFRTQSDTEVILAAYALHGLDGFKQLEGMFAFALVDERRRRIMLVRDTVGKKPLFVLRRPRTVLFGSSVLPLVACSGGGAEIDPTAAGFYWNRAYVSPDTSAIVGAEPVPPGVVLALDWQGACVRRSRCEPTSGWAFAGESADEVSRNISHLLACSVDQRLENNPDPVTLLSGGINSTVVTQITNDRMKAAGRLEPIKTLTLGALIPNTRDEYYARYAGRRLGLRVQIIHPARQRFSDSVLRALSVQDEPLGMPSFFLLHQMIEAAAQHGRVLLTGDGGDEVFLGYRPPADWLSYQPEGEEAGFVKVASGPSDWMGAWAKDVTGNTLLGHMLAKADRASAEQGVEMRCPLLDFALVGYVRSLPYAMLAGNGTLKPLLKSQLLCWPDWFLNRPKLGFAFNLRWRWALTRFDGLRDSVTQEAIDWFGGQVPNELQRPARSWTTKAIMENFSDAWKLLAWSLFLGRVSEAASSCRAHGLSQEWPRLGR